MKLAMDPSSSRWYRLCSVVYLRAVAAVATC